MVWEVTRHRTARRIGFLAVSCVFLASYLVIPTTLHWETTTEVIRYSSNKPPPPEPNCEHPQPAALLLFSSTGDKSTSNVCRSWPLIVSGFHHTPLPLFLFFFPPPRPPYFSTFQQSCLIGAGPRGRAAQGLNGGAVGFAPPAHGPSPTRGVGFWFWGTNERTSEFPRTVCRCSCVVALPCLVPRASRVRYLAFAMLCLALPCLALPCLAWVACACLPPCYAATHTRTRAVLFLICFSLFCLFL